MIACGAGLTIQHVKAGRAKVDYPRIIGHEITGVIEAVGEGVHNVAVGSGDRLFLSYLRSVQVVSYQPGNTMKTSAGILAAPATAATQN